MRSPFIVGSTIIALALAAAAIWLWGTRPEPTLMLFIGAELAIVGSAARSRDRRNAEAAAGTLGVNRS